MIKIAIITPTSKEDYLVNTVLDGLINLQGSGEGLEFHISSHYPCRFPVAQYYLPKDDFVSFAEGADLVLLCWGKNNTDLELAERLNLWQKTIYIDGSEVGGNKRYDTSIQKEILLKTYKHQGKIEDYILKHAAAYLRREKPYIDGIECFPFGIEERYKAEYRRGQKKDIDFVCLFGQDEYPLMRRHCREILERFCQEEGFVCATKPMGQSEFYQTLARSKVGVSVGGGGYDTARFWEILGNNCVLLTETVDIYEPRSRDLPYKRIHQFDNLYDYQNKLRELGDYIKNAYSEDSLEEEYDQIIKDHSSVARVELILDIAARKGIIHK